MTLEEIRVEIDAVDTEMKPLFLRRMECSRQVAEAKEKSGGDVYVPEREKVVIGGRSSDVDQSVRDEYVMFLRHLMSVGRRYQDGILTGMQETAVGAALARSGLSGDVPHSQVKVRFFCGKASGNLNLFVNMMALNQIPVDRMELESQDGRQRVEAVLDGNVNESNMRRLLCQLEKEAEGFEILELRG